MTMLMAVTAWSLLSSRLESGNPFNARKIVNTWILRKRDPASRLIEVRLKNKTLISKFDIDAIWNVRLDNWRAISVYFVRNDSCHINTKLTMNGCAKRITINRLLRTQTMSCLWNENNLCLNIIDADLYVCYAPFDWNCENNWPICAENSDQSNICVWIWKARCAHWMKVYDDYIKRSHNSTVHLWFDWVHRLCIM